MEVFSVVCPKVCCNNAFLSTKSITAGSLSLQCPWCERDFHVSEPEDGVMDLGEHVECTPTEEEVTTAVSLMEKQLLFKIGYYEERYDHTKTPQKIQRYKAQQMEGARYSPPWYLLMDAIEPTPIRCKLPIEVVTLQQKYPETKLREMVLLWYWSHRRTHLLDAVLTRVRDLHERKFTLEHLDFLRGTEWGRFDILWYSNQEWLKKLRGVPPFIPEESLSGSAYLQNLHSQATLSTLDYHFAWQTFRILSEWMSADLDFSRMTVDNHHTGSFWRKTGIVTAEDKSDVDMIFVLHPLPREASDVLDLMQDVLKKALRRSGLEKAFAEEFPNSRIEVEKKKCSIGISCRALQVDFDFVPARIPDKAASTRAHAEPFSQATGYLEEFEILHEGVWKLTGATQTMAALEKANTNFPGNNLKEVIQLVKVWNATQGKPLRGFFIENILMGLGRVLRKKFGEEGSSRSGLAGKLVYAFRTLADHGGIPLFLPGANRSGFDVLSEDEKKKAKRYLQHAVREIRRARTDVHAGGVSSVDPEAVDWKKVFKAVSEEEMVCGQELISQAGLRDNCMREVVNLVMCRAAQTLLPDPFADVEVPSTCRRCDQTNGTKSCSPTSLFPCERCRLVVYCSRRCEDQDREDHAFACF